jgi:hypothetical protein
MLFEAELHDPRPSMLMHPVIAVDNADRHRSSPKIGFVADPCVTQLPDSYETPSNEATTKGCNEGGPFEVNGFRLPRSSSSVAPIVVVVAPRSASFESDDPLFRGICLYNGTMKSSQRHEIESQMRMASSQKQVNLERRPPTQPRRLWWLALPSISKSSARTAA